MMQFFSFAQLQSSLILNKLLRTFRCIFVSTVNYCALIRVSFFLWISKCFNVKKVCNKETQSALVWACVFFSKLSSSLDAFSLCCRFVLLLLLFNLCRSGQLFRFSAFLVFWFSAFPTLSVRSQCHQTLN